MAVNSILIGCDPEFFLKDKNGRFISAHDRVPGTKQEPYKLANGGHVQADGTAVEFNIPPSRTPKQFKDHINSALNDIRNEFFKDDKNIRFAFEPVAFYDEAYFKTLPPKAIELGCDPDFSAYTFGKANNKPNSKVTFRTGSGHIHIGFLKKEDFIPEDKEPHLVKEHLEDCCVLAVALDYSLASFRKRWDSDVRRAQLYGGLGCFRPKPYGMEYRTLSNAWLNYPDLWPWLFQASVNAANNVVNNENFINALNRLGSNNIQTYLNVMHTTNNSQDRATYSYYSYLNHLMVNGVVAPPNEQLLVKKYKEK